MFKQPFIVSFMILCLSASYLIAKNPQFDPLVLPGEEIVPAVPEPAHVDELVIIPADEASTVKRLKLVEQVAKQDLTAEEREQAVAQLLAFDQQLIIAWAHSLKFASGRAFTCEVTPTPISDKRLAALFPELNFYSVALPGYFGGAAPTEMMLRSYYLPAILQQQNIIVVNKTGEMKLITGLQSRTQFFQRCLPAVLDENAARQAAAGWLLLAKQYVWQFYQQPQFTIDESKFLVEELHGNVMNLDVKGQAIAVPETNATGEISVLMRFAFDGKMQFAEEKQQIEFGMILMPPAAPPVMPPGPLQIP